MLELLGKEQMQEIMKKAFSLFYPIQMESMYGVVESLDNCHYFASSLDVREHLSSKNVDLFRYSDDYFVLNVDFFFHSGYSPGFDVCFRLRFQLCDLEVA